MAEVSETRLPSLAAPTPKAGFALAVKLARMGVEFTRPSDATRQELRPAYEKDAIALIAASHVIDVHFWTISAANN